MHNYYKPGSWNALCMVCGVKFKSDQLLLRWDGLRVCERDWEGRHPQDVLRVPKPSRLPTWTRPEAQDVFISLCRSSTAVAGDAVAGCAVSGTTI